jgi:hypothetical protein
MGNPYEGCRPECVLNSDCPSNQACISNKCQDPCPGTCGQNADCQVVNHLPSCTCRPGFTGDPFRFCNNLPPQRKTVLHSWAYILLYLSKLSPQSELFFFGLGICLGWIYIWYTLSRPLLWSSGQSSWLQIQRSRVRFLVLREFLRSSGSGMGSTQPREYIRGASWKK